MANTKKRPAKRPSEADTVERYRALLRALPDLVFIQHRDGTYTDFWAGTEADLAVPREKVIGINIRDIGFSPEELTEALKAIDRVFDTGETQTYEYALNTLRGRGHFEARIVRLSQDEVLTAVRNITSRIEAERKLREASRQLELDKQALEEKNIALEQVLSHLEQRGRDYHARVTRELEREIRPVLKRIRKEVPSAQGAELERLEERIESILARDAKIFENRYAALSQRELEVCEMLRQGLTSKQIAGELSLSSATIHKYREQIRQKLGFQGKRVNLAAYLRLHPASG